MFTSQSFSIHPVAIAWHPSTSRTAGRLDTASRVEVVMLRRRVYDESWRSRPIGPDGDDD